MDPAKQREIASMGGSASGGNFAQDRERASRAGKAGAKAQPTEAKRKGGENSHRNR
jgi:general stress protein YciG